MQGHARCLLAHPRGHRLRLPGRRTAFPGTSGHWRPAVRSRPDATSTRRGPAAPRVTVHTHFGPALTPLALVESELHAAFTDGRDIAAALAISALGTRPLSPSPWGGAIAVDSRLRSRDHENVYAAGGVAVHE